MDTNKMDTGVHDHTWTWSRKILNPMSWTWTWSFFIIVDMGVDMGGHLVNTLRTGN